MPTNNRNKNKQIIPQPKSNKKPQSSSSSQIAHKKTNVEPKSQQEQDIINFMKVMTERGMPVYFDENFNPGPGTPPDCPPPPDDFSLPSCILQHFANSTTCSHPMSDKILIPNPHCNHQQQQQPEQQQQQQNHIHSHGHFIPISSVTGKPIQECIYPDEHCRRIILYCMECKVTVCGHCMGTKHKNHQFKDLQDVFYDDVLGKNNNCTPTRDYIGDMKKLQDSMKECLDDFESIDNTYKMEVERINSYFRDAHDLLHTKELQLKNDLKAFHDQNKQIFTNYVEKINMHIRTYKEFQDIYNFLQSIKTKDNPDPYTYTHMEAVVQDYAELELMATKTPSKVNFLRFCALPNLDIGKEINSSQLVHCVSHLVPPLMDNHIIYRFTHQLNEPNNNIIEKIDTIKREKTSTPMEKDHLIPPSIGSIAHTDNGVYFFQGGEYYHCEQELTECEWIVGDSGIPNYLENETPIYDGRDHIYVICGNVPIADPNASEGGLSIHKFNIRTKEPSQLIPTPPCRNQITMTSAFLNKMSDTIYIVSGCGGFYNRIDKLNLRTQKLEPFTTLDIHCTSVSYDYIADCFYLLELTCELSFKLTQFSVKYHKYTSLKLPPSQQISPNVIKYSNMYFNGKSSIIIDYPPHSLFFYHIHNNSWEVINL
ncbi:hypothetical protein DLAC_01959 [Tieghemostelium lacteum]|uniref:B box-type domain-containing protein n=1 Tax=Tieghemostelium lacteum TaxID=361077 RepID=A0A152A5J9_TIELA|nr:hypothetical protein DLAC_01959 [Tieghemostelium lacteum]|eukprot:KYR01371.1 hypothetical protein DLAC_01959 [Tieghemostelium lacteum]